MPRRPKFKATNSSKGWLVNLPASLSASGRRERHYFKTREKAKVKAAELRGDYHDHGTQAAAISASLAEAAIRATEKLKPYDLTMEAAVNAYVCILDGRERSLPLREAASRWITVKGETCREATLKSYRYTLTRLAPLDEKHMSDITAEDVEAAIESQATSFRMHRRNARALFEFSAKKGWCEPGLMRGVEPRGTMCCEISVLSPAQVRKVMRAAEKHYPEAVPAFAIAFFGGMRMGELERLLWSDVHADGIEITSSTSKRRRRRFIPMNPTLKAWLKGRRPDDLEMLVTPASWREKSKAVRRAAGFKLSARLLKKPPKLPRNATSWPQNCMRHTHASAAVAAGTTIDELIFAFGHAEGPEMLKSHYVGLYRPRDAVAFWSIGPMGTKIWTLRAA
jgi:integrase